MRVNVHDFSGHPFQIQLSRELAARGHEVLHSYSTQFVTGRGRLTISRDDPPGLRIEGITASAPMVKYRPLGRTRFEVRYARAWQAALDNECFDVIVACNVPLLSLAVMRRYFADRGQPWVLWHQDLYSLGVGAEAARRLPGPLASAARGWFERLERDQIRSAAAVVAITDAMIDQYEQWGARRDHVHVIPNWAPLDDIVPSQRDNAWGMQHDLPQRTIRLMYAGTLGRKHNPLLLLELLDACQARGMDATLVVVSEGIGADDLAVAAAGRPDVRIIGYQPAEQMSDMLSSADVAVALLEPDAARFSVPSKVLSYLSAGRPIIALVPDGNPSTCDVAAIGGFVGPPTADGAVAAAEWLRNVVGAPAGLTDMGERARTLALNRFDIGCVTDRFETILTAASGAIGADELGREAAIAALDSEGSAA